MNGFNVAPHENGSIPCSADVLILGAGPGGLTAAYELSRNGISCIVLERDSVVGGLAKTVDYKGFLFDLGGHRFYTKLPMIERIWNNVLGPDFIKRQRLSRIYYRSRFFHYPLDLLDVMHGLGPIEILKCSASFLKSRLMPQRPEENMAAWVSNRFGRRLFTMFFESYTEKVWGMPCTEISADWAAQRIRGLSVFSLLQSALRDKTQNGPSQVKSLIREFHYPRRGPGMMWTRMKELSEQLGCRYVLNSPVERVVMRHGRIESVYAGGKHYSANHVINTLAIRDFFGMVEPALPTKFLNAALSFRYRDFITVGLIVRGRDLFSDNWIYVHDPSVKVGRIQNYTNWSPEMSPDPEMSSVGMEYFCSEGDELWCLSDGELFELARKELTALGLAASDAIVDGHVVRVPKAYPVYDQNYKDTLDVVREFLPTLSNLQLVGRNGMHRYNNQDHSMLTALMAARNILGANFNLWSLHGESEYLEEGLTLADADLLELEHFEATELTAVRKSGTFAG